MLKRLSPFIAICITGSLILLTSQLMQYAPLVPVFSDTADRTLVATISGVVSAIMIIAVSLASGILSDRFGRRPVIITSAVTAVILPMLFFLVFRSGPSEISAWQYIFLNSFRSLPAAILAPVALAAISDLFIKYRGTRLGAYLLITALLPAAVIWPMLILRQELNSGSDFAWIYLAAGLTAITAIIAAIVLPFSPRPSPENSAPAREPINPRSAMTANLTNLIILSAGLILTLVFFARSYFPTSLAYYLVQGQKLTNASTGIVLSVISFANILIPLAGYLTDRYGSLLLVAIGLAFTAIAIIIGILPLDYLVIAVFMGLFGLGVVTINIATYVLATTLAHPLAYGTLFGFLLAMTEMGEYLGRLVGNATGDDLSQFPLVISVLGFAFIVLSLFFFFLKRRFSPGSIVQS